MLGSIFDVSYYKKATETDLAANRTRLAKDFETDHGCRVEMHYEECIYYLVMLPYHTKYIIKIMKSEG